MGGGGGGGGGGNYETVMVIDADKIYMNLPQIPGSS